MASAQLTPLIATLSDLRRVRRELEELDEYLHAAALRQGGKEVKLLSTSRLLEDVAADSGLNLLKKTDRDRLKKFLTLLIQKAPVIHMSFASEPSAKAMAKIVSWLRTNIHPQVIVSIGIQPSIAAGCIVRTPNRQYDFSFRRSLDMKTEIFAAQMGRSESEKP